jgi:hypothetical protein
MNRYEDYGDLSLEEGSTSYFSTPEMDLDPSLFDGHHMKNGVRSAIKDAVYSFLSPRYMHPESWSRVWVAGSGVSYQWSADRDPADLDVMLGIDYVKFRKANPDYTGFSDAEIARMFNQEMHDELYPRISHTTIGHSNFEVTVYVNPGVGAGRDDLRIINPYAAYDVTQDEWTVPPNPRPMIRVHPSWDVTVETDRQRASEILRRYSDLLTQVQGATNPHTGSALKARSGMLSTLERRCSMRSIPAGSPRLGLRDMGTLISLIIGGSRVREPALFRRCVNSRIIKLLTRNGKT